VHSASAKATFGSLASASVVFDIYRGAADDDQVDSCFMEHKLTAMLCAEVYGYSRLMGDDEEATFRALASHRRMIDALIEQYHGRFVTSAGDSVLAEFASVVNAVQ
jgi:class 3 adenylate cyclase